MTAMLARSTTDAPLAPLTPGGFVAGLITLGILIWSLKGLKFGCLGYIAYLLGGAVVVSVGLTVLSYMAAGLISTVAAPWTWVAGGGVEQEEDEGPSSSTLPLPGGGAGVTTSSPSGPPPCGTFEPSPKHDQSRPGVGSQPVDGQVALDGSVQVSTNSARRIGVDVQNREIVVFDETYPGQCIFHGHVRTWDELTPEMKSALHKAGLTDLKGNIL